MTVTARLDRLPVLRRFRRRFARWPWATLIELAARAGYVARGAVYVSIGVIGLLAAAGLTPEAEGTLGALDAWGQWPIGIALLWLLGFGLYGFAGWRGLQAVFDVDRQGAKPTALMGRLGQAVSGVVYAGLAVSVFGLLDAIEDLHEADDQAQTREAVAKALEVPGGDLAVMAVGLFILGVGLASMGRAVFDHFGRKLDCDTDTRRWAGVIARTGYFGRGVAFLPAGFFTFLAGLHARAADARGLGGALEALKDQPYGKIALALLAVGFVAFGLFAFLEAWNRPMRTEAAVKA